jgi:eukaryotic-like serine/threonine-protein kinase
VLYVRSKTRGHTLAGATGFEDYAFTSPFYEGEVVCGKYEIGALLGYSASTFVVAARHLEWDDDVALKFLRPSAFINEAAVAQFAAEARAASTLESDFIARVFEVDALSDGAPFIVMERLVGQSLSQRLIEQGRLSCELAATYGLQTCAALSAAHALGVVHCGVRPSNLFLSKQAQGHELVKLLDFGICRAPLDADALGSLPYSSPELMRAKPDIDGRTDIWSLGCVLYECLSGVTPFHAVSSTQVCAAVLEGEPELLSQLVPGVVPIELEAIVMRCLEKERPLRFRNVAQLSRALLPFASSGAPGSVFSSARLLAVTSEPATERRVPASTAERQQAEPRAQPPADPPSAAHVELGQAVPAPLPAAHDAAQHAPAKRASAPRQRAMRSRYVALLPLLAAALFALAVGQYTRGPTQQPAHTGTPQPAARASTPRQAASTETQGQPAVRADTSQQPAARADTSQQPAARTETPDQTHSADSTDHQPVSGQPVAVSPNPTSAAVAAAAVESGERAEQPAPALPSVPEPGSSAAAASSGHAHGENHASSAHKRAQHDTSPPSPETRAEVKTGDAPAAASGGQLESASPPPPAAPSEPHEPTHAAEPAALVPANPSRPTISARAAAKPSQAAAGSIAPALVAAVIRSNAKAVQECFDRAQMDHPDLHGRMRFRANVDRLGHVTAAWMDNQLPDGAWLKSCILAKAREWKFPPPAGGVSGSVSYTFAFD